MIGNFDYIDIHSHLNFPEFDADREEVIQQMQTEKIATITVGTYLKTSQESVELTKRHDNMFATIGLHPADKAGEDFDEQAFGKLATNKKVVAVGECGLDYAFVSLKHNEDGRIIDETQEKKRQKEIFEKQIAFAVVHDLPLMIHCRDAYPDTLDILASKKREYGEKLRGNFHFFTSPVEIAKQCLDIGFTVSFTGPITFAKQYEEVVNYVPLERMMAETDSPFAAPVPYRGKRNNPLYVKEVVAAIARIKTQDLDTVRQTLVKNTSNLFLKNILSPSI